jgi:hypothetical protein
LASIEAAEKKAEMGSGSFFGAEKMDLPPFFMALFSPDRRTQWPGTAASNAVR